MHTPHLANCCSVFRSSCLLWAPVGFALLATASWLTAGPITVSNMRRTVFSTGIPGGDYVSTDQGPFSAAATGVSVAFSIFGSAQAIGSADQESNIDLTDTALKVTAHGAGGGTAFAEGPGAPEPPPRAGVFNISFGRITVSVDRPCSFVLRAATTAQSDAVFYPVPQITLTDGATVLASYARNSHGVTSGIFLPGHAYTLRFFTIGLTGAGGGSPSEDSATSYELAFDVRPPPQVATVARPSGGHFVISGRAEPLAAINIEASPDLVGPFVTIGQRASDMNGNYQYDDPDAATLPKRFYRASYILQ